jgi:hypothetical protein
MLEPIDERIGIGYVYAIGESFLLVLILIELVLDGDAVVAVLTDGVVLQLGGVAQPLVDLVEVGEVVRVLLVDLVEVGLAGGDVDALVDVAGLQLQVLQRTRLQTAQLL